MLAELWSWFESLHPEFIFLLSLPFAVALAAWVRELWLHRRSRELQ